MSSTLGQPLTLKKKPIILDEIKSQKEVIKSTISKYYEIEPELLNYFKGNKKVYFIGCGSSYHVGLIAKFVYDALSNNKSECFPSSEFIIYPDNYIRDSDKESIFILLSRTGKSTETVIASEIINRFKGNSIAITTFPNSELKKECDYSIVLDMAQEKSITATRSVTSSTVMLLCSIFTIFNKKSLIEKMLHFNDEFFKNFKKYSDIISSLIMKNDINRFVFLGSGSFFGVAKEAELKVKEMSLTNTESCFPLEYRHGHKAIIDSKSLIIIFISKAGLEYEMIAAKELKNLGARVLIIDDCLTSTKFKNNYNYIINTGLGLEEPHKAIFFQIFGQLIGYHQASKKGINPSNPKNLDYCVTF